MARYGVGHEIEVGDLDTDAVRDFESRILADVLDAVDQFAGHALGTQVVGQRDVERHGQLAFGGHQPARHVFRRDFEVGRGDGDAFGAQVEDSFGGVLDFGDAFLREFRRQRRDLFHVFAVARSQGLEVGLDTFGDDARRVADQLHFLDVHFVHHQLLHRFDAGSHRRVEHRNDDLLQRLAHFDRDLAAQGQHHRRELLGRGHHLLQIRVDQCRVGLGEGRQVDRFVVVTAAHGVEIAEDAVGNERCERCREQCHGLQTGVERLVGRQLVGGHLTAPEALAVEAYVPVGEVLAHEFLDGAGRRRGVVVLQTARYLGDQRVQERDDPAVDLGAPGHGYLLFLAREAVDVGVEGEERVGVVERAEKLAAHLVHTLAVELEVVPRL